jgi:hydroxymethylbilane synthase
MAVANGPRTRLVIGTRGSKLAVWQAEWVQARLKDMAPELVITVQQISTSGDKIQDVPLAAIGGKGLFVKEIEEALIRGDVDIAVHSMKDVPTMLPEPLEILCVPVREDPRDVLISRGAQSLDQLAAHARIGTSSLRRQAQLLHYRSDFTIEMLRGNLDTRLRKLREGHYEAVILAAAGLRRMGWSQEVTEYLPIEISLPAIGQGALGLEGRRDDAFVRDLLAQLEHPPTRTAVTAERALLKRLEGGCQVPIAGHATMKGDMVMLEGLVATLDGQQVIRDVVQGRSSEAAGLGEQLGEMLLRRGGDTILREIYGTA